MRLTLRTLLAYLDGSLPNPLVAEVERQLQAHETARQLLERMQQVVSRVRQEPPRLDPRDTMADPNRMAEYLDGTLDLDLLVDHERACLESDALLAEVVAGHQILSRLLREPMEISDRLRRRMLQDIQAETNCPDRPSEQESLRAHSAHRLRPPRARRSDSHDSDDTPSNTPHTPPISPKPLSERLDQPQQTHPRVPAPSSRFQARQKRVQPPIESTSLSSTHQDSSLELTDDTASPSTITSPTDFDFDMPSPKSTPDLKAAAAPSLAIQQRRLKIRMVLAASIVFPLGVIAAQFVGRERPADWDQAPIEVSQTDLKTTEPIASPVPTPAPPIAAAPAITAPAPAAEPPDAAAESISEAPSPTTRVEARTVTNTEAIVEPVEETPRDLMPPPTTAPVESLLAAHAETTWSVRGDTGQALLRTHQGLWQTPPTGKNAKTGDIWIAMPFDRTAIFSQHGIQGTLVGATAAAPFNSIVQGKSLAGLELHYGRLVLSFPNQTQAMRLELGTTEWSLEPLVPETVVAIERRPWRAPGEPITGEQPLAPSHELIQVMVVKGEVNLADGVGIRTVRSGSAISWIDGTPVGSGTLASIPTWTERSDELESACATALRRWTANNPDRVSAWRSLVAHERLEIRMAAINCLSEIGIYDAAWLALDDAHLAPAWRRWLIAQLTSQFARSQDHTVAFFNAAPSTPLAVAAAEYWPGVSVLQWQDGAAHRLVDGLEHESLLIRTLAIDHLAAITGGTERFIAEADPASRANCVAAWRARLSSGLPRAREFKGPAIVSYTGRD